MGRVGLEGPVHGEWAAALDEGHGEGQDDTVEAHPGAEEEVVDSDAHAADGDGEHAGQHGADDGEGRTGDTGGVDGGAGGLLPTERLDDEEHADEGTTDADEGGGAQGLLNDAVGEEQGPTGVSRIEGCCFGGGEGGEPNEDEESGGRVQEAWEANPLKNVEVDKQTDSNGIAPQHG